MAIDSGFESTFALRLKVRALDRRIRELESGEAYAKLKDRSASLQRGYEAKLKKAESKLASQQRLASKMRENWFCVFKQVERERDEAVGHARASVRRMEERALAAERRVDVLMDAALASARRIRELESQIEGLEGQNAKLSAHLARDFENSSIPSSAQGPARKKIPNTREAGSRKPGAQPGHAHHPRKRPEPTSVVELDDPAAFARDPDLYRTDHVISKVSVSARISVAVTEYRAALWRRRSNGARVHAPFPEGVVDEVNYDGSVKALAFLLANECCASAGKTKTFLYEASQGVLDLSVGMIGALVGEFAQKSDPERDAALASLMSSPIMHADFTCANVGGQGRQVLIVAGGDASAMCAREAKGHKGIKDSPLAAYVGCVVHDHDTTFYSYGQAHQECMQHNIRYLIASTQNESHLTWNARMLALVREMIHWRHSINPDAPPGPEALFKAAAAFEQRYDDILKLAACEYDKSPPTKYCRDGYNLFVRLRDYKESELRFVHDLRVPPDNSRCERLARVFKRKQRQAIAFRSFKFLGYVCDSMSAINNMRAEGKDVFAEASAIFSRPKPARP